jgi:signal transduction histidine kinase
VDATRERIRLLAHDLRPPALDTVGLNLTLEDFCHHFSRRTSLAIAYHGVSLPGLPDAVNICLYRFLQEALTNVARHAQATQVEVRLQAESHTVCLAVTDNGRGFASGPRLAPARQGMGLGLVGMQERIAMLGGWLDIESVPGQHTRLAAFVPMEKGV